MSKPNINFNVNRVRSHLKKNVESCRDTLTGEVNYTLLAEMTAAQLNLYVGHEMDIPEKIFELAAEFE